MQARCIRATHLRGPITPEGALDAAKGLLPAPNRTEVDRGRTRRTVIRRRRLTADDPQRGTNPARGDYAPPEGYALTAARIPPDRKLNDLHLPRSLTLTPGSQTRHGKYRLVRDFVTVRL